ncbi:MAG TPA: hypothetical protein VF490_16165, partial [Chryseosolibacter sp.]
VENDFRTRNVDFYTIGDNYLVIQFSVNEEGKAVHFDLVSPWGNQFYFAITTAIQNQAIFPKVARTMYFHLKLHFPGGSMYQYSFAFSDSRATPSQF